MDQTTKIQGEHPKVSRATIGYAIFLLAWAALALIASQFIWAFILVPILGAQITSPLWTAVYDLLTYALSLVIVIFLPPRVIKYYQKWRSAHPKKSDPDKGQKPGAVPKSKPGSELATSKLGAVNFSTSPTELGINTWPTFTDIGLAPIAYIVYIFFANLATMIMSNFAWFNADETQDVGFSTLLTGSDRFFAMLALVFIAPIAEELVMRGWLYGKLRNKLNFVPAMLLTSLLFAVLHGQWNVGVTVFFLSVVSCALREITGSLWSSILLHILNNGIAFYLLYVLML